MHAKKRLTCAKYANFQEGASACDSSFLLFLILLRIWNQLMSDCTVCKLHCCASNHPEVTPVSQKASFSHSPQMTTTPIRYHSSSPTLYFVNAWWTMSQQSSPRGIFLSTVLKANLSLPSDLHGSVPRHTVAEWFQMEEVWGWIIVTSHVSITFQVWPAPSTRATDYSDYFVLCLNLPRIVSI